MYHRTLLLAAAVAGLLLVSWAPPQTPLNAQDTKPAAKKRPANPFNENMTWDEADKAVQKVVDDDDDDAYDKISAGRLAWVPLLLSSKYRRVASRWAYGLMEEDIDAVRSLQAWETILCSLDAKVIEKGYLDRAGIFRHPEAQLARAIIHVGQLGDRAALKRLCDKKPDSPWVKAALAWLGEYTPGERIDALLAVQPKFHELTRCLIGIAPGQLDDDVKKLRYASTEYCKAETGLMFDERGVRLISDGPSAWRHLDLYERLGEFISELPDEAARKAAFTKAKDAMSLADPDSLALKCLRAGAFPEQPLATPIAGQTAQSSSGPLMRSYALDKLKDFPISRRICALAVFHGAPGWSAGQGFLLHEAGASDDAQFARLAARAVLGLNDDLLAAIVNVARESVRSPLLAEEAAAFRKALATSQDDRLLAVSDAMAGKGEYPQTSGHGKLGLDEATRVALLCAFADPLEIKTYGGAPAVYWMNRGAFLAAQMNLDGCVNAYARAVELSGGKDKPPLQSTLMEASWALRLMVHWKALPGLLEPFRKQHPAAIDAILRVFDEANARPTTDIPKADLPHVRLEYAVYQDGEFDDEARANIEKDGTLAGGIGELMLGYIPAHTADFVYRNSHWQRAERMAPASPHIYEQRLHMNTAFLRWSGQNWFEYLHLALCHALLRPFALMTFTDLSSVSARAGVPARGVCTLVNRALRHAFVYYSQGDFLFGVKRMQFARQPLSAYLSLLGCSLGKSIREDWHEGYHDALSATCWGLDLETNMNRITTGGHRGEYLQTCVGAEYVLRNGGSDVNFLLNMAMTLSGLAPDESIRLVGSAEKVGISRYGGFVGAQSYVRAKAALGEYDAAMKRYHEFRDGRVGYPPYLDQYLLYGLCEGNQYKHIPDALKEINQRETDFGFRYSRFAMRRALMAIGHYDEITKWKAPDGDPNSGDTFCLGPYSPLFHEARGLLEKGDYAELIKRASVYWNTPVEDSVGVQLDAFLLWALASRLQPHGEQCVVAKDGKVSFLARSIPAFFSPTPGLLDTYALEILAGEHPVNSLPAMDDKHHWHGMVFSERPALHRGGGFLSDDEGVARDHFVRGVLAFLADDAKTARTELKACTDLNQRCSYEYHVAQWLLEKKLAKDK